MFFFVFFWGKWFLEAMLFWYLVHVYCVVVKIILSIKVFIVCLKKKKKKSQISTTINWLLLKFFFSSFQLS